VQIVGKDIGNLFMNMELEKKNLKIHKYDKKRISMHIYLGMTKKKFRLEFGRTKHYEIL
jgi:hypothetical protein